MDMSTAHISLVFLCLSLWIGLPTSAFSTPYLALHVTQDELEMW